MSNADSPRRGGRGARERILAAAVDVFYREGIHVTGVARLAEAASVSSRTFYQHFPSKNALVAAYLERIDPPVERRLDEAGLSARERLVSLFDPPGQEPETVRGCPFHNAVVEGAGELPEVREIARRHKDRFTQRLVDTAAEAGARDPEELGRQLAVLFEGALALSTSCDDVAKMAAARSAAEVLVAAAVEQRPAGVG
ncbi:TetR/AcrR family transcriptional regulator [Actinokineospora bangkokensis]|uniref:TetR/AcrR family transcriptional regulator n=1 Tax=Actinokineospora bangkokensis TaxID=1193682 RepID=UPI0018E9C285|nr:TetR/AcrR family transcriptional regulator [Actinokineospora bangkokensis]